MNATDAANLVDRHIGARIEMRRAALGLTRETVAQTLGVSAAQVEALERGEARAASRQLYAIARLFDVTVAYFFDCPPLGPRRDAQIGGGFGELDRAI